MVTATVIAALIAAGIATGKAISKGVQAKRHREERQEKQEKVSEAMHEGAEATMMYRRYQQERGMQGLQFEAEQMQPLYAAMEQVHGGAGGYEAPDLSWIMQYGADPRKPPKPEARKVKPEATRYEPKGPTPGYGKGENPLDRPKGTSSTTPKFGGGGGKGGR